MFGLNPQQAPSSGNYNSLAASQCLAQAPQEFGVGSAMQDLIAVVNETGQLSHEIKVALGISSPKDQGAEPTPSSLVGLLRGIASSLRNANADLTDTLRHLQS